MTETKIEWTDKTWNPVTGCTKVSAGCKNCYAERVADRFWKGRKFTDVVCHDDRLDQPLRWRKPSRVFVNSMSDLFHEAVPDEFIDKVFAVMAMTPQHTFQVLTKRPERMREYASRGLSSEVRVEMEARGWTSRDDLLCIGAPPGSVFPYDPAWPLTNVWLGVSCENQEQADKRIPLLLQTPAAVRFLSCEPLLGPLRILGHLMGGPDPGLCRRCNHGHGFTRCPNTGGIAATRDGCDRFERANFSIGWVIVGGESGPGARPCDVGWIRSIVEQCREAQVPVFCKQLGANSVSRLTADHDGRRKAGFELGGLAVKPEPWRMWLDDSKGGDPSEWPADLHVREFPETVRQA